MKRIFAILSLSLVVALALILAAVVYAQGPTGDEKNEGDEIGEQGLANPPPSGYTVVYMFTGAAHNAVGTGTTATTIHCTNYGSVSTVLRVEYFDYNTTAIVAGSVTLAANTTRTISTQGTATYSEDLILTTPSNINQGSGRIMINNSAAKIICTVQVLDPTNNPPRYGVKLNLFDSNGNLIGAHDTPKVYLPLILKANS